VKPISVLNQICTKFCVFFGLLGKQRLIRRAF